MGCLVGAQGTGLDCPNGGSGLVKCCFFPMSDGTHAGFFSFAAIPVPLLWHTTISTCLYITWYYQKKGEHLLLSQCSLSRRIEFFFVLYFVFLPGEGYSERVISIGTILAALQAGNIMEAVVEMAQRWRPSEGGKNGCQSVVLNG